jgi:sec-independent protein translocase protein TatA
MGGLSLWHWIIVLLVVLILFGRGRISDIMGDFGKGIKSFKEGINEESAKPHTPTPPPAQIAPHTPAATPEQTVTPPPVPSPAPTPAPTSAENNTNV